MTIPEGLKIVFAVGLAAVAALESSHGATEHEVRSFLAAAFEPQIPDLYGDPGYMNGVATEAEWLPATEAAPSDLGSIRSGSQRDP